ncbi:MAG: hypothetical protein ABJH72_10195, partial [Reichenbachiella sp.]
MKKSIFLFLIYLLQCGSLFAASDPIIVHVNPEFSGTKKIPLTLYPFIFTLTRVSSEDTYWTLQPNGNSDFRVTHIIDNWDCDIPDRGMPPQCRYKPIAGYPKTITGSNIPLPRTSAVDKYLTHLSKSFFRGPSIWMDQFQGSINKDRLIEFWTKAGQSSGGHDPNFINNVRANWHDNNNGQLTDWIEEIDAEIQTYYTETPDGLPQHRDFHTSVRFDKIIIYKGNYSIDVALNLAYPSLYMGDYLKQSVAKNVVEDHLFSPTSGVAKYFVGPDAFDFVAGSIPQTP